MINDDLLDGKIKKINKRSFDNRWIDSRKIGINKYLTDIIRREIFGGEDREFYSNIKYRGLVELEINDISNNAYYSGFDIEKDYIKDDFDKILEMLKRSFRLEENASYYGLDNILDDINKLDYLDYSNVSKYLDMLEYSFSGIDKVNLKEFLMDSSYLPMNVKYKEGDYISLYRNKLNSLIMDNNDYYIVSNNNINEMESIIVDSKYSDKGYIYGMFMNHIMDKYNSGKKLLEVRKKKQNEKR
jgi:hypothetical protein